MIQRRLGLIDEAELDRRQDDDDQNGQRDRRFDERGASLPASVWVRLSHPCDVRFLATGETLVFQTRLQRLIGFTLELVVTLHAFANRVGISRNDLWRDEHDQLGLAASKLSRLEQLTEDGERAQPGHLGDGLGIVGAEQARR